MVSTINVRGSKQPMTQEHVGDRIADAIRRTDIPSFRKAVIEWLSTTGLTAEETAELRKAEEKSTA